MNTVIDQLRLATEAQKQRNDTVPAVILLIDTGHGIIVSHMFSSTLMMGDTVTTETGYKAVVVARATFVGDAKQL
jgi:hypothetical protein